MLTDKDRASRRSFFRTLGGVAVAAAATLGLPTRASANHDQFDYEIDLLNFALNLEYLEAEFYTYATDGIGIPPGDTFGVGFSGPTTGGSKVNFVDPLVLSAAVEIANDERAHVRLLRNILGRYAIAKPAINLNAQNIGFANENQFLLLSRAFEDIGVSAYGGMLPFLDSEFLTGIAGRILSTESYHAGNIRQQIVARGLAVFQLDWKDQVPTRLNLFPTDGAGLAVVRNSDEVLNLVYPFFPNGLNGRIG